MASSGDVAERQAAGELGKRRQHLEFLGGKEERITRSRCRVCQEAIIETTVYRSSGRSDRRYHCCGCGIRYEFVREETEQ